MNRLPNTISYRGFAVVQAAFYLPNSNEMIGVLSIGVIVKETADAPNMNSDIFEVLQQGSPATAPGPLPAFNNLQGLCPLRKIGVVLEQELHDLAQRLVVGHARGVGGVLARAFW